MQGKTKLFISTALWIFISCGGQKKLSPDEYLKWVNDPSKGLIIEKQIGNYKFWMQYRPIEYEVLSELRNEQLTKSNYSQMYSQFKDMQYVLLRIGGEDQKSDALVNGIHAQEEYYDRIRYFTTDVKNDLYLIDGLDTLPCLMHHFERSYRLNPYSQIMLAFKQTSNLNTAKTLMFDDHILGVGRIQITIAPSSIKQIPKSELP